MGLDVMDFPNTFEEFAKSYGFKDAGNIYTNGADLIPVFRVEQWLEHIKVDNDLDMKLKLMEANINGYTQGLKDASNTGHWIDNTSLGYHVSICSNCDWRGHGDTWLIYKPKYCPNCGCRMVEPTCDTCEYNTAAFNPCNACENKSEYKPRERSEQTIKTAYENIDKEEISKSVALLDLFTKTFCRYRNDYERFDDLKFRCDECPFQKENGLCLIHVFKNKYAPDYRDFGSMGDFIRRKGAIKAKKAHMIAAGFKNWEEILLNQGFTEDEIKEAEDGC